MSVKHACRLVKRSCLSLTVELGFSIRPVLPPRGHLAMLLLILDCHH